MIKKFSTFTPTLLFRLIMSRALVMIPFLRNNYNPSTNRTQGFPLRKWEGKPCRRGLIILLRINPEKNLGWRESQLETSASQLNPPTVKGIQINPPTTFSPTEPAPPLSKLNKMFPLLFSPSLIHRRSCGLWQRLTM